MSDEADELRGREERYSKKSLHNHEMFKCEHPVVDHEKKGQVKNLISTSKNTISDESSLICVFPLHKNGLFKRERKKSVVTSIVQQVQSSSST